MVEVTLSFLSEVHEEVEGNKENNDDILKSFSSR